MIKDADQKLRAVRYCIALGLVPYVEVIVRYTGDTAKKPTDITDIDVLGVQPASVRRSTRSLFDCKTQGNVSPINRALWAGGLKAFAGCDEAFVILKRPAPEGHRLAAATMSVKLFSDDLFQAYAKATAPDYAVEDSYLIDPAAWEALWNIVAKYPNLESCHKLVCSEAPLFDSAAASLRALMATAKRIRGELDPAKAEHRAVVLMLISQFLLTSADLVIQFQDCFDHTDSRATFEENLRYFIWEGRENYEIRARLFAMMKDQDKANGAAFDLPAWDEFLETFRSLLDAPLAVGSAALPAKELAFRELVQTKVQSDQRLLKRLQANNRVKQFITLGANYITSAAKLPREFKDAIQGTMSEFLK